MLVSSRAVDERGGSGHVGEAARVPRRPFAPDPLPYADVVIPAVHLDRESAPGWARAQVARGAWFRLRRGAYVEVDRLDADPYVRGRQLVLASALAVDLQTSGPVVFSHGTAAAIWGLPLYRLPDRTHVLVSTAPGSSAARDVARHEVGRPREGVVERRGLLVTTLERTVVDCARTLGARGGLVVADAALAAGARRELLDDLVAAARGGRGVRCARDVVAVADDGAESAGESLARWSLIRAGLPRLATQVPVETHLGTFWADLGWQQWRLAAEYDGVAKYGGAATSVVLAEKRRQEAIEEAGWRVVRLTAADIRDPIAVGRRLRKRLPAGVLHPTRLLAD